MCVCLWREHDCEVVWNGGHGPESVAVMMS